MKFGLGIGVASSLCLGARRAPGSLFRAADTGFWYDPSVISTLFQDAGGSVPVSAAGQAVGRIRDRSGRARHASQATSAARPTFARMPQGGRRNRLPDNSNTGAAPGVIGAGGASPVGRDASSGLTRTITGFGTVDGMPYFDIRFTGTLSGGMFVNLAETTGVPALAGQTWVTSAHLQVIGGVTGVDAITMIQSTRLASGALKFTYGAVSIGFPSALTRFSTVASTLSNAEGAAGNVAFMLPYLRLNCIGVVDITMRIAGTQAERNAAMTALQLVRTAADITEAGKPGRFALFNDLIDDALTVTLPTGTYTVAYGDDSGVTVLTGQAVSGSYTLPGPARLYGAVAINRALSAAETARLTAWLTSRRP